MALTANFWALAKRRNSTKQPDGAGASYAIQLHDPTDVLQPSIKLLLAADANPTNYNYCQIPAFGRYYYVTWRWAEGFWWADCEVDPWASYKVQIGASHQYVLRSDQDYDGDLTDNAYPVSSDLQTVVTTSDLGSPWTNAQGPGYIVIGVAGNTGMTYYAIGEYDMGYLLGQMFTNAYADTVLPGWLSADLFPQLKVELNPMQFIQSAVWLPYNPDGSDVIQIPLGWGYVEAGAEGVVHKLTTYKSEFSRGFSIPTHPQAAARGAYLRRSPYSEYYLYFPPFGLLALDADVLGQWSSLFVRITVDDRTGSGTAVITAGQSGEVSYDYDHVARIEGSVGVPYAVTGNFKAGAMGPLEQLVTAAKGFAGSVATQSPVPAIEAASSLVTAAWTENRAINSSMGSVGGVNSLQGTPCLINRFHLLADEYRADIGRPLCKDRLISSLSGFIACAEDEIAIDCSPEEREQIAAGLKGGFYFE